MSLLTQERVDSALKVLKELNISEILSTMRLEKPEVPSTLKEDSESKVKMADSKSLSITLQGLASMHSPSKTSIIYSSPVDPDGRLYSFAHKLRDIFMGAELLIEDNRSLLLHATIVNTVYVPGVRGKGSGHGNSKAKLTLDATELLEDYEGFVWMEGVRLEKVAICRMGAKKNEAGDEEYVVEGEVNMP